MNQDQRNFSTLSALVLLMIFSACSGGGGGGGGIGSAPPDDKVFNQWALTATPISYDCPVIGENADGTVTKTQFNATTAETVGDGLEIRNDEAATDPNGCNLGNMPRTSYELVDPDNMESCHVSGKKIQIVTHRPFPRADDGSLGMDDNGCTTEATSTINLTISDDGLTATGDVTGLITYVGNCAQQYFGTDKKSCTAKARLEGEAPAAADGNALGNGANGSCTPKTNPYLGHKFTENALLKDDADCDGVYSWLPSRVVRTLTRNGVQSKQLTEHFLDLNAREGKVLTHSTDDPNSPITAAKIWKYNASQTVVTTKSYNGDPTRTPVSKSTQTTYDATGNELNSKEYDGDFELRGAVRHSTVNTFSAEGEYLSMKFFNGDFSARNAQANTSIQFFYNYEGFFEASKTYTGDFDNRGILRYSETKSGDLSNPTFNYTSKTKDYDGDFEVPATRIVQSVVQTMVTNNQGSNTTYKSFVGDCDAPGAVMESSQLGTAALDYRWSKSYSGDYSKNGRILQSNYDTSNEFGLPLTSKIGTQSDVEKGGAVSTSMSITYDAYGNMTHSLNYIGSFAAAHPVVSSETTVETYIPIRQALPAGGLSDLFSEYVEMFWQ